MLLKQKLDSAFTEYRHVALWLKRYHKHHTIVTSKDSGALTVWERYSLPQKMCAFNCLVTTVCKRSNKFRFAITVNMIEFVEYHTSSFVFGNFPFLHILPGNLQFPQLGSGVRGMVYYSDPEFAMAFVKVPIVNVSKLELTW